MKRRWLFALFACSCTALFACAGPVKPPVVVPPAPETVRVIVHIEPAVATHVVIGATQCDTSIDGTGVCEPLLVGDYFIKLDLPDTFEPDAGGHWSFNRGACPDYPDCVLTIKVTKIAPTFPLATGRVLPCGEMFCLNGALWPWRGATDFMLFRDYLDGKDISGVLAERATAGATLVRVLGMAHYIPVNAGQPAFNPFSYDHVFNRLADFVNYVATFGLRVEFTALVDAQILLPSPADQLVYLQSVIQFLPETAFLEIANEPWKNGADVATLMASLRGSTPILATGNYDWDGAIVGFYITVHESRDDEWPRKTRLDEWYEKYHLPVVWDEPIGADESNQPGRRSNVADDFYDLCAGAALHGAGVTFHSTPGLLSQLWGAGNVARAAAACYSGAAAVPAEAPQWAYSRGGLTGLPILHDDAKALRTWCQIGPGRAVCEAVRPAGDWQAIADNGWRIVSQTGPNGRLVFLER